ncbi:hypothetical protein AC249_AIPGENE12865 [Exaiptasia diaphana]|nr:hypothetical protein AC249_AIPGENE12865 [Exaiptasia diaphana]
MIGQNTLKLDPENIKNLTRLQAFQCILPQILKECSKYLLNIVMLSPVWVAMMHFVHRRFSNSPKPRNLLFFVNVGKKDQGKVFLGDDDQQGSHWTLWHLDSSIKKITYCDSIGWPEPSSLLSKIGEFVDALYAICFDEDKEIYIP